MMKTMPAFQLLLFIVIMTVFPNNINSIINSSLITPAHGTLIPDPKCPVRLRIADCKGVGLGHLVMALITGLDAANHLNASLCFESSSAAFWSEKSKHSADGYAWAAKYFPVHLTGHCDAEAMSSSVTKTTSPRNDSMHRSYSKTMVAREMTSLKASSGVLCDVDYLAVTGSMRSCQHWSCSVRHHGLYYRGSLLLQQHREVLGLPRDHVLRVIPASHRPLHRLLSMSMMMATKQQQQQQHHGRDDNNVVRSDDVVVVWHVRVGDAESCQPESAIMTTKTMLDRGIPHRRVQHIIVTSNSSDARRCTGASFASLPHVHYTDVLSVEEVFSVMLQADILVALGSSLTLAAGLLSVPGHQLYVYFPPMAMLRKMNGAYWSHEHLMRHNGGAEEEAFIASHMAYQTAFTRYNIIPVNFHGTPLTSEYDAKMVRRLACIDQRRVPCTLRHDAVAVVDDDVNATFLGHYALI